MKIIGHRGAKNLEPENTLRSIARALEYDVSYIEIDVYRCASGQIVVIHDETVDRTTNGTGLVMQKTLAQLKELDAGKGEAVPTLQEVIEFIDQRVSLIIEIKDSNAAEVVAELVHSYYKRGWDRASLSIASFNHYDLMKCKNIRPEIPRMPIFEGIPLGYTWFVRSLHPAAIILYYGTINEEFVQDAHTHKIALFAYTVNDRAVYEHLKQIGVDAVATDSPDQIRD
ncbi:MAG: glycerophosphodiester phosphodiesterase family protein [Candidatus Babeliales bacterium]